MATIMANLTLRLYSHFSKNSSFYAADSCTSLLFADDQRLGDIVGEMKVWVHLRWRIILGEVKIVRIGHPHPVWVPRQVILGDPHTTTLLTTTVKITRDRVGVLDALTLLRCLHPLDGVTFWLPM